MLLNPLPGRGVPGEGDKVQRWHSASCGAATAAEGPGGRKGAGNCGDRIRKVWEQPWGKERGWEHLGAALRMDSAPGSSRLRALLSLPCPG